MQFIQNQRSTGLSGFMSGVKRPAMGAEQSEGMKFGSDLNKNE